MTSLPQAAARTASKLSYPVVDPEITHTAAAPASARANEDRARNKGSLSALREAATKLDENAACEAIRLVEAELQQAPTPEVRGRS